MKLTRLLAIVLVMQLALALYTGWPEDRAHLVARPLLDVDRETLTGIEIARRPSEGSEAEWLKLRRDGRDGPNGANGPNGADWTIESANGFPADREKVEQLVTHLFDLRVRAPIATSPSSHNALSVGESDYGRRVKIRTDAGERELVVGADRSNSMRVRFADEDDVYVATGISEFALVDAASAYWSKDYVQVPVDEIRSFVVENERGSLRAERNVAGWTITDAPPDTRADAEAIEKFLAEVTTLSLVEPLGTDLLPDHGLDDGPRIGWTLAASDQSISGGYTVGQVASGQAIVKSDTDRFVVKVQAANVARIGTASAADFLLPVAAPPVEPVAPLTD